MPTHLTIHFQLPGTLDSESLQRGLHVMNYQGRLLPVYTISAPSQLFFAMPTDSAHLLSGVHISLPGEEDNNGAASYDMEIPVIMLESLRPGSPQSSESTGMELVDEDTGSRSLHSTGDLTLDGRPFDAEIIDLTGED